MGQRHILHCDCNCFYASVEMQEHPELRGKSIAVCGDPEARHGIVLTASYPAKRMGVKTGMPIWEAKQHCRDLIIVPASYGKYQKYSGYVREIFRDYTVIVSLIFCIFVPPIGIILLIANICAISSASKEIEKIENKGRK